MITLKEINIVCVGDNRYRFNGDIINFFDIGYKNEKYNMGYLDELCPGYEQEEDVEE